MKAEEKQRSPKQRIIDTAIDLFFRQGYSATGINQILKEADVARATFYFNFPSKEDLCKEYIITFHQQWLNMLLEKVNQYDAPYDRVMAVFEFLDDWMESCDYRGCALMNLANEFTDTDSKISLEVVKRYDLLQEVLKELLMDLKRSDKKYAHIRIKSLTEFLFIVIQGAVVTSKNYRHQTSQSAKTNFIKLLRAK